MGAMMRLMQHNIYEALRSLPGTLSTHHKWQQYPEGSIPILSYMYSILASFQAFFWAKAIQKYFMLVGGKDLASSILSLCKHLDFTHALMITLTSLLVNFLSLAVIVQSLSHAQLCASPWTKHARLPCPSLSPRVCSNSCPLSRWWYLTISSSAAPFSFCLQSFPASGSLPVSWLCTSGGQSIDTSDSV